MHTHDCKIIGIAGGSGVGKSTLAIGLVKKWLDVSKFGISEVHELVEVRLKDWLIDHF